MLNTLTDVLRYAAGIILILLLAARDVAIRHWIARFRVGMCAVLGFIMLGTTLHRALLAGAVLVGLAIAGIGWPFVNAASAGVLVAGILAWTLGIEVLP